jgi:hypothetical protein
LQLWLGGKRVVIDMRHATVWALLLLLALGGCKADEGDGPSNPVGLGGAGAGAGIGGAGGAGAVAGTGGAAGIAAGGAGGSAGAGVAGTGAAGTGGGVPGCSAADMSAAPSALHAAAAAVLTTESPCSSDQACPCGSSSCHGGRGKANLVLVGTADLNMALVGKMSCQAPSLPLVAAGGGDPALTGSWLWQKLVAPADSSGVIASNAAWGMPNMMCNQSPGMQPYGIRMPWSNTDLALSEARLAPIRNWICAGAPGP